MKTTISSLATRASTAFMLSMATVSNAIAQDIYDPEDLPETGGSGDLTTALKDIVNVILNFLAIVALIVIVIAGIRLIIGGADEQQREKTRNAILYAVIGLVIVFFAKAIVVFIFEEFTGNGTAMITTLFT